MAESESVKKIKILGACVDLLGADEAACVIASAAQEKRDGRARLIFTPNAQMALRAYRDPEFGKVLCGADVLIPDGAGMFGAAKRLGTPLPARTTGIDAAYAALAILAAREGTVYLLGARDGVAAKAARALEAAHPGLRVAGVSHGYFEDGSAEEKEIAERIRASAPDLVVCCLGSPRQEMWSAKNADRLGAGAIVALGGALDVWSGEKRRAPRIFIKIGCEWLWRMTCEPRRFAGLPALAAFRWKTRRKKHGKTPKNGR